MLFNIIQLVICIQNKKMRVEWLHISIQKTTAKEEKHKIYKQTKLILLNSVGSAVEQFTNTKYSLIREHVNNHFPVDTYELASLRHHSEECLMYSQLENLQTFFTRSNHCSKHKTVNKWILLFISTYFLWLFKITSVYKASVYD